MNIEDITFLVTKAKEGAYKTLVYGETKKYKDYMRRLEALEQELRYLILPSE